MAKATELQTYPLTGIFLSLAAEHTSLNRSRLSSMEQLMFFLEQEQYMDHKPRDALYAPAEALGGCSKYRHLLRSSCHLEMQGSDTAQRLGNSQKTSSPLLQIPGGWGSGLDRTHHLLSGYLASLQCGLPSVIMLEA